MVPDRQTQDRILLAFALAAAVLIHVSIAGSQILLGAGILLLLVFRHRLEFPRIWIPLAAFFAWTILADALSPDPWRGMPQVKKFFVFLFIPLIYGVFVRQFSRVYYLVLGWALAAGASGFWSLAQFVWKLEQVRRSGENFYTAYVGRRITGFETHWLTFGALELTVVCLLLAQFFFSSRRTPLWVYASAAILSIAILLSWDRSIWIAAIPAVLYLVWFWKPKMTLVVPVLIALGFAVAPGGTRQRLESIVVPHGDTDSNRFREVTFRTGIDMIEAHPWFGIGPEEIRSNFDSYVPAGTRRPLPPGYYGHLHNDYVQYAAERGIPGLLFILWFIGWAAWDCGRAIFRNGRTRSEQLVILHGTLAVIIAVLVGGLAEYNLGDSEVLMMFVTVISLGYAAIRNGKASAAEPIAGYHE